MIRILTALLLICLVQASAQTPGNFAPGESSGFSAHLNSQLATKADGVVPPSRPSDPVRAMDYGTCTWDATHDVGACINAAIAVAAARGGATVVVPAGIYGQSTPIVQHTNGVHLVGAGLGWVRDNFAPSKFVAITRLVWIGTAGATMLDVEPASLLVPSLYSADVDGIVFDCASLADVCVKISQTTASTLRFGVSEPRSIGAWLTTSLTTDGPGTQINEIWIYSRSSNAAYSPTGILIDAAEGSTWNVSYNKFYGLYAWYKNGDGIVIGNTDNNLFFDVGSFPDPGGTGTPFVFAAPGYIPPNGVAVTGVAGYSSHIFHVGTPIVIQGFTAGSTLAVGGGNTGTAAFTPVALTTNAIAGARQGTLSFASTTGVDFGMTANCGTLFQRGCSGAAVAAVTPTAVRLASLTSASVASGTGCSFSYGVNASAVPGTYTITASAALTFDIAAPVGGTTQSGVVASGGVLRFTDVVLPVTGSAVAGDTWTIVVKAASTGVQVDGIDKANQLPDPIFMAGSTGSFSTTTNAYQVVAPSRSSGINQSFVREACNGQIPTVGLNAVNIGNCGGVGASGVSSTTLNGAGNSATGFGSTTIGGHVLTASGIYSVAMGDAGTASGYTGRVGGASAIDRGRYAADCWGGGSLAASGDAQGCKQFLRGTGATGSAFRVTADGAAAGSANCINLPNNSAYSLQVTITAFDHTTVTKSATWPTWTGLLTRGANAAATAVAMNTTPTPLTNGTVAGMAIAATADTTNGCLDISFTPPTSNTDTWNVAARVKTVEVQ